MDKFQNFKELQVSLKNLQEAARYRKAGRMVGVWGGGSSSFMVFLKLVNRSVQLREKQKQKQKLFS